MDLYGKEFVVDVGSREFRDADNPENAVKMYSVEGRRMVREMLGMEWRVFRADKGRVWDCAQNVAHYSCLRSYLCRLGQVSRCRL